MNKRKCVNGFQTLLMVSLCGLCLIMQKSSAQAEGIPLKTVNCEGEYKNHVQGVCADDEGNFYWSWTTQLVKTDPEGKILVQVPAPSHQGDLCWQEGAVYVAVNLGAFNQPAGKADSWVYQYDPATLKELHRYPVQEVVHGAGGIDYHNGSFFVVGGLPGGVPENYIYEYSPKFEFKKRHVLESGTTLLGIQTAHFHHGAWWFGCYGKPAVLLKATPDFQFLSRQNFDSALGIIGVDETHFLVARNTRNQDRLHVGKLVPAVVDKEGKFSLIPEKAAPPAK